MEAVDLREAVMGEVGSMGNSFQVPPHCKGERAPFLSRGSIPHSEAGSLHSAPLATGLQPECLNVSGHAACLH